MVMRSHPSRPRSRFIASRSRDFTVPNGMRSACGDLRMRLLLEEGQFDDPELVFRQPRQRAPDPRFHLRGGKAGIRLRPGIDLKLQIDLGRIVCRGPFLAAEPVDAQVARDGEYPGRRAGACGIEQRGL